MGAIPILLSTSEASTHQFCPSFPARPSARTSPVSGSRKFTSEVATWQMCLAPHAC
jgi:hypothetical protein